MRYVLLLLLIAPFASHADDCLHNWMQCPAGSSMRINSFSLHAAYVASGITAARNKATKDLKAHRISVDQAKAVLSKTDRARELWDQARATCQADATTGDCQSDEARIKAFALLDWSERAAK